MKKGLGGFFCVFIAYYIWSVSGREKTWNHNIRNEEIGVFNFQSDSFPYNIVGIQPYLNETDYRNQEVFQKKLDTYFSLAQQKGYFKGEQTIVVLPEYIGTWLVVLDEKNSVFESFSVKDAMRKMVFSNVFSFCFRRISQHSDEEALFKMKARKMKNAYVDVFTYLAKKYKVQLIGGSIVLPNPKIENERLKISSGSLFNTSVVFSPKGTVLQIIKKQYPIVAEKHFTESNTKEKNICSYEYGQQKVGVLICADSWYPQAYEHLKGCDVLAIPSLAGEKLEWRGNWAGYNGWNMPNDVDSNDIGTISEEAAWILYSMCGRAINYDIHYGINVFFSGSLWDMQIDGKTIVLENDQSIIVDYQPCGQIVNLDYLKKK